MALRTLLTTAAGVVRSEEPLTDALERLQQRVDAVGRDGVSDHELMALLICRSALSREESRGGHLRSDYPQMATTARHTTAQISELTERIGVDQ